MISRRQFLAGNLSLGLFSSTLGRYSLAASTGSDPLLVMILLRGGVDGLALAPVHGDRHFSSARRGLQSALSLHLEDIYGLNYSMQFCHQLFRSKQLSVVHAVGGPYANRSHFDAQQMLESGGNRPFEMTDGWMNRALGGVAGNAIALSTNSPLLLRGTAQTLTWQTKSLSLPPQTLFHRLEKMYEEDPLLKERLKKAMSLPMPRRQNHSRFEQAAEYLTGGLANLAVIELNGWDTHSNQTPQLNRLFEQLDNGLKALRLGLDKHWERTVVLTTSEFGRTVRANGTRGTDHGSAGVMLLAGGAVNGGRVIADWPGLHSSALVDGRDLRTTTDMRSVFKALLVDHLGLNPELVESRVFPASDSVRKLESLFTT